MSMCMLIVTLVGLKTPNLTGDAKSEPVGIAIVFLLFLFIFFYKPSWGATVVRHFPPLLPFPHPLAPKPSAQHPH